MQAKIATQPELLNEILELLRSSKLPYQDISPENNIFISYQDDHGRIVGSGGLELYGSYALLRSLAVLETQRGRSIGKEIVMDLLSRTQNNSICEVYLLTETASDFFRKFNFVDVNRADVPNEIKVSTEFKSVCPASATCMVYRF